MKNGFIGKSTQAYKRIYPSIASAIEDGEEVGTDQIVSAQPGLVPQEKGKLTRARIWGATVFIDYYSDKVKVHLMQLQLNAMQYHYLVKLYIH